MESGDPTRSPLMLFKDRVFSWIMKDDLMSDIRYPLSMLSFLSIVILGFQLQ